jgi:hypothetical protein
MDNQIYFKIAGQVDLDVLIIFTPCQIFVSTVLAHLTQRVM